MPNCRKIITLVQLSAACQFAGEIGCFPDAAKFSQNGIPVRVHNPNAMSLNEAGHHF
jgi:hypothetical protein